MWKFGSLLVIVFLLAGCVPLNSSGETISDCRAQMSAFLRLRSDLKLPEYFHVENPAKQGSEFDVMEYFTALDHLSMKSGYKLDYVYHYDGMGGYPLLYAYPSDQLPYATEADLPPSDTKAGYLDYVEADGTAASYFQFVVLALQASQFYQYWHAGYNDTQIVCDKAQVDDIVTSLGTVTTGARMPLISQVRARLLQGVEPTVIIGDQTVEVRLVTFTEWGGFYLTTYTISRSFPHTIQDVQGQNLIPYDCGIMF